MWPDWNKKTLENRKKSENMNLRQVMEFTREMDLREGGLSILLEKFASEIEHLRGEIEWLKKSGYKMP